MTARPRLVRSIPFWVLLAGSLALTGLGAWLVADRVGRIGAGVLSQTPEGAIEVYAGPSVAVAGAALLGAGLVGILLTLTVATLSSLRPEPTAEVVEPIDWSAESDEDDLAVEALVTEEPTAAAAPTAAADGAPAPTATADPESAPAAAAAAAPTAADSVARATDEGTPEAGDAKR